MTMCWFAYFVSEFHLLQVDDSLASPGLLITWILQNQQTRIVSTR